MTVNKIRRKCVFCVRAAAPLAQAINHRYRLLMYLCVSYHMTNCMAAIRKLQSYNISINFPEQEPDLKLSSQLYVSPGSVDEVLASVTGVT